MLNTRVQHVLEESYACGDTSGGGTRQRTLAGSTGHGSLKQEADTRYTPGIFGQILWNGQVFTETMVSCQVILNT